MSVTCWATCESCGTELVVERYEPGIDHTTTGPVAASAATHLELQPGHLVSYGSEPAAETAARKAAADQRERDRVTEALALAEATRAAVARRRAVLDPGC